MQRKEPRASGLSRHAREVDSAQQLSNGQMKLPEKFLRKFGFSVFVCVFVCWGGGGGKLV